MDKIIEIIHTGSMVLLFLIIAWIALRVQLGLKKGNRADKDRNRKKMGR